MEVHAHHQPRKWQHDQTGDYSLNDADENLLNADTDNANRRKQTIFDLFAPSEIDHQRQGHGLHAGNRHAESENSGQQHVGIALLNDSHPRHYKAEDERKHQRVQHDAQQERHQLASHDMQVAMKEGYKRGHTWLVSHGGSEIQYTRNKRQLTT